MMLPHDLSPIGLDIGSSRVKAVQLRRGGVGGRASSPTGWSIAATTSFDRLSGEPIPTEAEARRLVDVLRRRGLRGRRVVAAAPQSSVLTAMAELPPRSSGAPIDHLARLELARSHGKLPHELEAGCWDLPASSRGGGGGGTSVMIVGCAHADAETMLASLEPAGFDVVALEPRITAATRVAATRVRAEGGKGITVLIDLGSSAAAIAVLVGGVVVYTRVDGQCGSETAITDLATRLDVSHEDAALLFRRAMSAGNCHITRDVRGAIDTYATRIAAQVCTALEYARYRYPDHQTDGALVYGGALGGEGRDESVAEAIGATAELNARVLRATDVLAAPEVIRDEAEHPSLVTAAGLAMHGLSFKVMGTRGAEPVEVTSA